MELNYYQQLIVIGIMKHRRDVVTSRFAGVVADVGLSRGLSREARQRRRLAAYDAQAGLVPMRLANLLGHAPTPGERVRFHREYARLEAMGLLKRHAGQSGRRTTHVKLTASGQKIACQLLAQQDTVADEPFDIEELPLLPLDWSPPACAPAPE